LAPAATVAERPGPSLAIHLDSQLERQVPLHGSLYRIGRDPNAEVVLDQAAVSRRHALLERRGDHWLLKDAGSTNGLWWQGRRVQELLLRDGDRVRLGPPQLPELPEIEFHDPEAGRRLRGLRLALLAPAALAGGSLLVWLLGSVLVPIRGSLATVRGPLLLYDRADRPIASADDRRHREQGRLEGYPRVLIDALLASEDSRFWWHPGIDPIGTGRALVTNLLGGRVLEGGSTLTQQLARSLYPAQVGEGENLGRKVRELLVALQLEARFSKADLLLSYLNRAFLGAGWGFEDASRRLFGKPAGNLALEEAALLVGLLSSPYGHDPCTRPQDALEARNAVLHKMADTGRISADQGRHARRLPIRLSVDACRGSERRAMPFYSDQVRRDLDALVGADVAAEGNYLVDTHLDPSLQELIERLLQEHIEASRSLGVSEGAVVVLDSRTGGILAIVGGHDYRKSQFNRASMALRQPGSTFKLVPYTAAIERGARPGDAVNCGPLTWQGQVFDSACRGSISLRQALAISSNTAAMRLARRVGLEAVVHKARDLGFSTPLDPVPGLALGQSEVTLLELSAAYAAVADNGLWHAPSTIRHLTDAEACPAGTPEKGCRSAPNKSAAPSGARPKEAKAKPGGVAGTAGRRAMSPETSKLMQELLRGVVNGGTGTAAWVSGGVWGKTGTTNDGRDLLFVGAVPDRHWVMGVWLGNDDNAPSRSSSHLAAELWGRIVRSSVASP
jgi:membrane peptidoglycan carboxypeptidase